MSSWIETSNQFADVWWSWVVHAGWQSALVAILALAAVKWGTRWPSVVRYGILCVALVKFAIPPLAAAPGGLFSLMSLNDRPAIEEREPVVMSEESSVGDLVPVTEPEPVRRETTPVSPEVRQLIARDEFSEPPDEHSAVEQPVNSNSVANIPEKSSTPLVAGDSPPDPRPPVSIPTWKTLLMLLHAVGAIVILAWMIVQVVLLRRLLRKQTRVTEGELWDQYVLIAQQLGLRRRPDLYLSHEETVPYSHGVLRPAVVLPRSLIESLSAQELRAVLAHELSHHRRGDFWLLWFQIGLLAVWWFHPLMWLLTRALRRVREDCCDDMVLESRITSRQSYCETLLAVAAKARNCQVPAVALSAVQGHSLESRFRRIMDQTLHHRDRLGWGHRLVLLILAVLLLPGLNQAADEHLTANVAVIEAGDAASGGTADSDLLGTVTGTVVSASGDPVTGADILVILQKLPAENEQRLQLLQRGKTDSIGAFAIPVSRSLVFNGALHSQDEIQVWVSHPKLGWTAQQTAGMLPSSDLTLTLINPEPLVLTILDPKGRPASDVEVSAYSVRAPRHLGTVPEQIQDRFAGTTDHQGQARLASLAFENLSSIEIESETYGKQILFSDMKADNSHEVTLRNAVPLRGKLVGQLSNGRSFEEISLKLITQPIDGESKARRQLGLAEVQVNKDGTFRVPALAVGMLRIDAKLPDDFPVFAQLPKGVFISSDLDARVTIPLKSAVRVSQTILDAETQQTVPDVLIYLHGVDGQRWSRTDENGIFTAYLPPHPDYSIRYSPPSPYLSRGGFEGERLSVPPGVTEHQLPPLELVRGVPLAGNVTDEKGDPVKAIKVTATWKDRNSSLRHQAQSVSDEQGHFQIIGVHPTADLELKTYQESVPVGDKVSTTIEQIDEPLKFVVNNVQHIALTGKVIDRQGQPVVNADYTVMGMFDAGPNMAYESELHSGKTGGDGQFRTPAKFHPQGSYWVVVLKGDKEIGHSKSSRRGQSETHSFDVVVNDVGDEPAKADRKTYRESSPVSLSAFVTNRDGEPVTDSKVIVWTLGKRLQLRTSGEGRFRLPEVYKKGVWVFVDAEGYRFFGEFTEPSGLEHRIVLTRTVEPVRGQSMRTLTNDAVTEDVLEQAQFELIKFAESVLETEQEFQKWEILSLLPQLSPAAGLDYLDDPRYDISKVGGTLTQEWHQNRVRFYASQQLIKDEISRAIATAKELTPGSFRVYALCELTDKKPDASREHRDGIWQAATSTARNIKNPSQRLEALTTVGASMLKQGETERGTALLKEAVQLANQSYQDQLKKRDRERDLYARARLAWILAPVDLETALKLVPEFTDEYKICRYFGNIAHQIADVNPAEAERVFQKLPDYRARSVWGVRVCYRMAKVDYKRARKIADTIASINLRPYAWGVMAQAVVDNDPEKAKQLLAEAYAALEELVDSGQTGGREIYNPLIIAVALLPVAEQVDPDRLREYVWRALSFRTNVTTGNRMNKLEGLGPDPVLGAFLSRYDRELAGILIRTDFESLSSNADEWLYFLLGGLTTIDPAAAVELVSQLPEQTEDDRKFKVEAWKQIVPMLVHHGQDRWNWLQDRQYNLWQIDDLDL